MSSLSINTSRWLPLGLVILAHALLVLALVRGSSQSSLPVLPVTMEVSLLPPAPALAPASAPLSAPVPVTPRPAVPNLAPSPAPSPVPKPVPVPLPLSPQPAPMPAPSMTSPPAPVVAAAADVPSPKPPAPVKPEPAEPVAVATPPRADASRLGNNAPVYPPLSRRLGEQGRVLLNLYILADGSLGQVVLKQSSGYRRLDDAAITAVKAWKFIPAHQNGAVVAAWYLQNVAFSLRDTP